MRSLSARRHGRGLFSCPPLRRFAGDPIMPLVAGAARACSCTGYSVVRGTTISSFDVDVLDVIDGEAAGDGARILVGSPARRSTRPGIGPGFSGSPIYCPDGAGRAARHRRDLGVDRRLRRQDRARDADRGDPRHAGRRAGHGERGGARAQAGVAADEGGAARARSRSPSPLTVSGLSAPLGARARDGRARRPAGRCSPVPAGPARLLPAADAAPGSAVGGRLLERRHAVGAIGTVAYTDGDRVWAFGHQFEGAGGRALLLQDAYVFRVINNPLQLGQIAATYKLAASGHDLGTLTNDGFSAVAGRTGALPHTVPVQVIARRPGHQAAHGRQHRRGRRDRRRHAQRRSWTSFVAPLAVAQAASSVLGSSPGPADRRDVRADHVPRAQEAAALLQPLRLDRARPGRRRQLGNAVAQRRRQRLGGALAAIDAYKGTPPHVTGVNACSRSTAAPSRRSCAASSCRRASGPASGSAPGSRCSASAAARSRAPTAAHPARRQARPPALRLVGQRRRRATTASRRSSSATTTSDEGGDPGPATLDELAGEVRATERYDGVTRAHRPRPRRGVPRRRPPHLRPAPRRRSASRGCR